MKWFDNWFLKKSKQAWETATELNPVVSDRKISTHFSSLPYENDLVFNDALQIKVLPARGGTIVQISKNTGLNEDNYKENKRFSVHTYVISEEESLSEQISRIISMELVR